MSEIAAADMGSWLSPENLEIVRRLVPMVYVNIVPVRLDERGQVEAVGLLLCACEESGMSRSLVGGRVLLNETLRDALTRHLEEDLGPVCLPQLPASLVPFAVTEYMPLPGAQYQDPRQHAVALAYMIPMRGECSPCKDALEIGWFTVAECLTPELLNQLSPAHSAIVRQALSYAGYTQA